MKRPNQRFSRSRTRTTSGMRELLNWYVKRSSVFNKYLVIKFMKSDAAMNPGLFKRHFDLNHSPDNNRGRCLDMEVWAIALNEYKARHRLIEPMGIDITRGGV